MVCKLMIFTSRAQYESGKMNEHILIIDNDKSELRKLRQILSREGYNIMTATDIETAVSICKNLRIKYVLGESEFFNLLVNYKETKK